MNIRNETAESSTPAAAAAEAQCVVTVGMDSGTAELVNRVLLGQHIPLVAAFPEYLQHHAAAGVPAQLKEQDLVVCLIDFDRNRELAFESATALQAHCRGCKALVAVSAEVGPEQILEAMRAGCNEYLQKPLTGESVAGCLEKLRARHRAVVKAHGATACRILGFLGVRGGCGTSTMVVHLGAYLSRRQARKVLVIDLHPHLGHAAMLLGLEGQGYGFSDLVSNISRLDQALLDSFVARHSSGLHLLRSPDVIGTAPRWDGEGFEQAIGFLRSAYDFVLLDCAPGFEADNQALLRCGDELHLVSTPELTAVRDLARYLLRAGELNVEPAKLRVVINQMDSRRPVTVEQIKEAVGHPIDMVLPYCRAELVQAADLGEPISGDRKTGFAGEIRKWAAALAPVAAEPRESRWRLALWS